MIFGNGGSAAIASHVAVDFSKNASVRMINFNEADLITCLANDYGFENWMAKAIEIYGGKFLGVTLILVVTVLPTTFNLLALNNLLAVDSVLDWGVLFSSYLALLFVGFIFLSFSFRLGQRGLISQTFDSFGYKAQITFLL